LNNPLQAEFKIKVWLAVLGMAIALILVGILVDPLSRFEVLLDIAKKVDVDFSTKVPMSATIEKNMEVQIPANLKASGPVPIRLATLTFKKEGVRVNVRQ